MLTEVKAFSSWRSAPTLPLSVGGRPETDLIQIRDIQGLDPVKASVNTSPLGSVDGASLTGSSVDSRNIVLTLHPNPDWKDWTFEGLRRLLYSYFMPKQLVQLVIYSDDMIPVEIFGIVEDVSNNMFSKDPEILVSIICPSPYFTAVEPVVIVGQNGSSIDIEYEGTIEAGVQVKINYVSGSNPTIIMLPTFEVIAGVSPSSYFEMGSIPMQKFIQNVDQSTGVIKNLLDKIVAGSKWLTLQPGVNEFSVLTDNGVQDWELTYFERFGGL